MNGLDDAERAEVLYDVYAANVYQNGNGEDEQGRVLHTMFDQVIIENVSFKLDIENPIIRINTAFKGCSSLEKISVLPRIYHN